MLFQIIIFAAIAGFFIYRLYNVLGRRTGHQPAPPGKAKQPPLRDANVPGDGPRPAFTGPAAAGMEAIRRAEPGFDPDDFLDGARSAYEMIVQAFADGDRKTLKRFTAGPVYQRYETAIEEREEKNHSQTTDIVRLAKTEIADAELDGKTARVSVRFEAELTTIIRDADGEILEGDPSRIRNAQETWTFERETAGRDPNWILARVRRA